MDTNNYFWRQQDGDLVTLGLNDTGREALGNVKFVELPSVGENLVQGEHLFDVEAEKTVLDLDSPLSGEIIAVHQEVEDNPDYLDDSDSAKNWLFKIKIEH